MLQPGGPGLWQLRQLRSPATCFCSDRRTRSYSLFVAGCRRGFFMNLYCNIDRRRDRHVGRAVHAVSRAGGKMKTRNKLVILLALLFAVSAVPSWGEPMGAVKGVVKDPSGKPMDGATVELVNLDTGRKYELKTNAKGEYQSIAITPGTYDISLMKDGKVLDKVTKVPIVPADEPRVVNFDFTGKQAAGMTEDQKKQMEVVKTHNEKVKTLNASLAQAKQLETAAADDMAQANQLEAAGKRDQAEAKKTEASANYEQAVTVLQQATQVDPNQDLIWFNLGDAQRGAKKYTDAIESYQKAIATFDKAIQADPTKAAAYYWKGVNLVGKATTKGDKMVAPEGTAQAFNKYLELDPNGQYADAAKQLLASIGAPVQTTFGKQKTPKK